MIFGWVKELINPVTELIDGMHTSEEERSEARLKMAQLQIDVTQRLLALHTESLRLQSQIIHSETKGGWLQRNWRPLLMVVFMLILVNNYVILPYGPAIAAISGIDQNLIVQLDFPAGMWALLTTGVGGYITSRGIEKGLSQWKGIRTDEERDTVSRRK